MLLWIQIKVLKILWRFCVACLMMFNAFAILNEERLLAPRRYTLRRNQPLLAALIPVCHTARFFSFLLIVLNTMVMLALFNSTTVKFNLYFTVLLLTITLCTYLKRYIPKFVERKPGFEGIPWKAARIGERLSPWISAGCLISSIMCTFL